ncbi:hypothetical protein SLA2020_120640 [Shorea laevis]
MTSRIDSTSNWQSVNVFILSKTLASHAKLGMIRGRGGKRTRNKEGHILFCPGWKREENLKRREKEMTSFKEEEAIVGASNRQMMLVLGKYWGPLRKHVNYL